MADAVVTIAYTSLASDDGLLTKRMFLDDAGALVKQPAANPVRGAFTHFAHTGTADDILSAYADVLRDLTPYQAIIAARLSSPFRDDGGKWRLTTKNAPEPGALPRSQTTFHPVEGPALLSIDVDVPVPLRQEFPTPRDLYRKVLLPAWPGFADVAMLGRASASSGAKLVGAPDPLPSGYHVAAVISDGTKTEPFAVALFDRVAVLGFALIEASRSGAALKRALVDVAAAKGAERLIFEADPSLGRGVEAVRRPFARHLGGILDVDRALAKMVLSADERTRLKAIWREALTNAQPDLAAAREKWLAARGAEIAKRDKVEPKEGRRRAEREHARFEAGELRDDYQLHLDSGEWVTIDQILANPKCYAGKRCWSLDEPVLRPGVGLIQPYPSRADPSVGKPEGPWLHSFEHGGRYWRLRSHRLAVEKYLKADRKRKEALDVGR